MRRRISRLIEHVTVQRTNWSRAWGASAFSRRVLGTFRRLCGNVGKHPLECFAPGRIRGFLRRVLRLAPFTLSGGIGRRNFLWNHHHTLHIY
jgi:hypothetical protein